MAAKLVLSVVDQSPVRVGGTATDALTETIELAAATEAMGYHRYWLAEHHSLPNFAGTSPEVLAALVASRTKSIRVGSGGVMLSHYSAFKVAENFRMLAAVHPGRIDLGIGRAPGSDQLTALAMTYPGPPNHVSQYPQQVLDLLGHLSGSLNPEHAFAGIRAGPGSPQVPQVWMLGSRYDSAYMAAQFGLPFSYAHFFGIGVEEGPAIVQAYRRHFMPSEFLSEPLVNVGVQVLCADTAEEALRLASGRNLARLLALTGRAKGIPSPEEAQAYTYQPNEWEYVQQYASLCLDGDPRQVKEKMLALAQAYQTPDLSVVTICYGFEERVRSYQLLAEVCGIDDRELR